MARIPLYSNRFSTSRFVTLSEIFCNHPVTFDVRFGMVSEGVTVGPPCYNVSMSKREKGGDRMGHQKPTPLVPLAERKGCGYPHEDYNPNCFGCHIQNGGSDD